MSRAIRGLRQGSGPAAALASGLAAAMLAACGSPQAGAGGSADQPPQFLPVSAKGCLEPPSQPACIELEVARTDRESSMGLQMRPPLPPLRGMWFPFTPPAPVRFWMHRTPAPLDMLFLRDGRVIAIEARVPPCMNLPCRSYGPDVPVEGVLEVAGGEAQRLGIRPGTAIRILPVPSPK